MSRVLLGDIPRLTFYDGSMTRSRRGKAIPQLTCRGKSCDHYRPDVIRCTSMGGSGADVDWKCEAELPESLRLGRVEVSCEGWSGPGDSYVFKESCGLEYRLVDVPRGLRDDKYDPYSHRRQSSLSGYLFFAVFFGVLIFILYNFFSSCFRGSSSSRGPPRNPPGSGPRPYSSRSGPRRFDDTTNDPPPPYSATDKSQGSSSRATRQNESPFGFWTGAALGGIGTYLATRNQNNQRDYDWERRRAGYQPGFFDRPSGFAARPARSMWDDDRGEGSSSGATRRSTGFGGSNVR